MRFKHEVYLGIFFFLVIALLIYMFQVVGGRGSRDQIEVRALFDSASGLVKDNYVMIAGVPIGYVDRIDVKFNRAEIHMRIRSDVGLRKDARAAIRARSLLGEKFVELVPQGDKAPLMEDGGLIEETTVPVEVDEVFSALRPFFDKLEPMAPQIESILAELEQLLKQLNETGGKKRETLERIIDRTDELLSESNRLIGENGEKISRSLSSLDRLLRATEERAPKLLEHADKTLQRIDAAAQALPIDTLKRIPDTYNKVDGILDRMLPLVERMDRSGDRIESILKNLDILMQRMVLIDELAIRKFLQEEGVKVNLTQDSGSKERIRELKSGK